MISSQNKRKSSQNYVHAKFHLILIRALAHLLEKFEIILLLVNLLIKNIHQSLHRIIAVAVVVLHRVDTTYLHTTTNSLGSCLRRDLPMPASR